MNTLTDLASVSTVKSSRCKMKIMPPEVLIEICTYLSRDDLKNVRLVCRNLKSAAQVVLFNIFYLKLRLQSFQRFQSICRHTIFRKHVRAICFDPRQLHTGYDWVSTYDYWRRHIAGTGMGMFEDDAGEDERNLILEHYSQDQLAEYYSRYCHFILDFKFLLRRGNWTALLLPALQGLSGLSTIYFSGGNGDRGQSHNIGFGDELPPMGEDLALRRDILAEPSLTLTYDTDIWALLKLVNSSGHVHGIKKVSAVEISPDSWKCRGVLCDKAFEDFAGLESLLSRFQ